MEEKVQKDDTEETLRNKLKSLERTRNIKVWHDIEVFLLLLAR
jgi:hypothetical protein